MITNKNYKARTDALILDYEQRLMQLQKAVADSHVQQQHWQMAYDQLKEEALPLFEQRETIFGALLLAEQKRAEIESQAQRKSEQMLAQTKEQTEAIMQDARRQVDALLGEARQQAVHIQSDNQRVGQMMIQLHGQLQGMLDTLQLQVGVDQDVVTAPDADYSGQEELAGVDGLLQALASSFGGEYFPGNARNESTTQGFFAKDTGSQEFSVQVAEAPEFSAQAGLAQDDLAQTADTQAFSVQAAEAPEFSAQAGLAQDDLAQTAEAQALSAQVVEAPEFSAQAAGAQEFSVQTTEAQDLQAQPDATEPACEALSSEPFSELRAEELRWDVPASDAQDAPQNIMPPRGYPSFDDPILESVETAPVMLTSSLVQPSWEEPIGTHSTAHVRQPSWEEPVCMPQGLAPASDQVEQAAAQAEWAVQAAQAMQATQPAQTEQTTWVEQSAQTACPAQSQPLAPTTPPMPQAYATAFPIVETGEQPTPPSSPDQSKILAELSEDFQELLRHQQQRLAQMGAGDELQNILKDL